MSENYAFPDRMMLFRRDREMTQGDHFCHDPSDWHWYTRADLYEAASGDLIPKADADLAVALAVQKAADQVSMSAPGRWLVVETDRVKAAILALAPATALAEVAALKAERDGLKVEALEVGSGMVQLSQDLHAAEAEVTRLRTALQTMVDSYEASSELHTSSADCAANLYDRARDALTTKGDTP